MSTAPPELYDARHGKAITDMIVCRIGNFAICNIDSGIEGEALLAQLSAAALPGLVRTNASHEHIILKSAESISVEMPNGAQ